jgi:hypothetical protein
MKRIDSSLSSLRTGLRGLSRRWRVLTCTEFPLPCAAYFRLRVASLKGVRSSANRVIASSRPVYQDLMPQ